MLPRSKNRYFAMAMTLAVSAGFIVGTPVQAAQYLPPVAFQELSLKSYERTAVATSVVTTIQPITTVPIFTLAGITWTGKVDSTSIFQVRVRENGVWSSWQNLTWSSEHGPDAGSVEAGQARMGTDPLLTAPADAIEARVTNVTGTLPTDLKLDLSNSNLTSQDRSLLTRRSVLGEAEPYVTSPQGAVVARPRIISRVEWGADETWRDADAAMGTGIIAGFMHHTASTNAYAADQGPAQMRALYAYYTKGLHYKDMAYSFLVDRYGNIYEGRSGCPRVMTTPCDGPSMPAVGAHTAAMNVNTFAVSVIGNYQTENPPASNLAAITEAVASIMAWKIAPYGLKPDGYSDVPVGADPDNLSRYAEGDLAHIQTISGHRDVGRTVCPGQFLYPSLPKIRDRINQLLTPGIRDAAVTPTTVDVQSAKVVNLSAYVPAGAQWLMQVISDADGSVLHSQSGTATEDGVVTSTWNRTNAQGAPVAEGRFKASIAMTVNGIALPSATSTVVVTSAPTNPAITLSKYVSKTKRTMSWAATSSLTPTTYKYRTYSSKTRKWSSWKATVNSGTSVRLSKLVYKRKYKIQVQATNALGTAPIVTYSFTHKK